MSTAALVQLAQDLATEAHRGQFRRGGVIPYIEHPRTVVARVGDNLDAQVVAWLHDVIEDSAQTAETLMAAGIPAHLVEAVVLLTKSGDISYEDYLEKVAANPLAAKVKIADMLSNLADTPTPKQIRKYAQGLLRLARDL